MREVGDRNLDDNAAARDGKEFGSPVAELTGVRIRKVGTLFSCLLPVASLRGGSCPEFWEGVRIREEWLVEEVKKG
jgi:hypothetical protein